LVRRHSTRYGIDYSGRATVKSIKRNPSKEKGAAE
jgi:hypothetical protein